MLSRAIARTQDSTLIRVAGILLFAVVTAISAQVRVLLPFSPVPLTLQVLVVLLSGFVLGARGGLLAQLAYLQAILLGAPLAGSGLGGVAAFVAPSAGYLWAFPVAAFLAGWLAERPGRWATLRRTAGGLAGLAVIYLSGALWLSGFVGGLGAAWRLGVAPFALADLLKLTLALAALSLRKR